MPKQILTLLAILSLTLFTAGAVQASWLDKLKETATELTDKAGEALKEAEPETPTTSDGEGQPQSPATASPAKPAAPKTQTVTQPAAPKAAQPAPVANTGNNNKTLVRNIQQELKRLGYNIGVDGAYGPNTKKQIIAFEQSQSLEPSGDASVELLAKLKEIPTPKAAEPAATTTAAAPTPEAAEPNAPEPKVEKVAASAPAATKVVAAAATAPLSPEAKMTYESCQQNQSARKYYSCQCLAENIESYIGPAIDSQTDHWKKRITGYEGAIKKNNANPNFTAEKKAQMEDSMRQQIKRAEEEIAKIEDRAGWPDQMRKSMVQSAQLYLYQDPVCKVGDTMHTEELARCEGSSAMKNTDCACYADTTAKLWTSSDRSYSSKTASYFMSQARTQCRK